MRIGLIRIKCPDVRGNFPHDSGQVEVYCRGFLESRSGRLVRGVRIVTCERRSGRSRFFVLINSVSPADCNGIEAVHPEATGLLAAGKSDAIRKKAEILLFTVREVELNEDS